MTQQAALVLPSSPFERAESEQDAPLSVSALSAQIKGTLEETFPRVSVIGEVSNFSRPQSGHCYFTLKDDNAQIRAVMWRGTASRLKFDFSDGLEIVCTGKIDVYAPRGSYQLVVDQAQPKGVGSLELAFRQLRERLGKEGLFDSDRKQAIPRFPKRIGFVTSPTGAAVRDFLQVLDRRWRGVEVIIIPARVQGDEAAEEIADGIAVANRLATPLDVLVVGRGGGSLEDLWCFNEEVVVREIANSRVPVISAVGHEIDVTLSDFAADVRALTPSEAAELAVPSADEVGQRVASLTHRLHGSLRRKHASYAERVQLLSMRRPLAHPHATIDLFKQRLDDLSANANRQMRQLVGLSSSKMATLAGVLESLSPLGVLHRGYSLTQNEKGQLVRRTKDVKAGEEIVTRVADGKIISSVKSTASDNHKSAK